MGEPKSESTKYINTVKCSDMVAGIKPYDTFQISQRTEEKWNEVQKWTVGAAPQTSLSLPGWTGSWAKTALLTSQLSSLPRVWIIQLPRGSTGSLHMHPRDKSHVEFLTNLCWPYLCCHIVIGTVINFISNIQNFANYFSKFIWSHKGESEWEDRMIIMAWQFVFWSK